MVLIFDVSHLLKCLRNAMLKCDVVFDTDKVAQFEYIQTVFELDQRKEFKTLKNLTSTERIVHAQCVFVYKAIFEFGGF